MIYSIQQSELSSKSNRQSLRLIKHEGFNIVRSEEMADFVTPDMRLK